VQLDEKQLALDAQAYHFSPKRTYFVTRASGAETHN
jgi:hypothetical protein